jgi:hypothetical protein
VTLGDPSPVNGSIRETPRSAALRNNRRHRFRRPDIDIIRPLVSASGEWSGVNGQTVE